LDPLLLTGDGERLSILVFSQAVLKVTISRNKAQPVAILLLVLIRNTILPARLKAKLFSVLLQEELEAV
jgi:hypothetical protein